MTTPLLPYSVTFYAVSTAFMYIDSAQRGSWSNNYYQHRLGPGTYMLQVAYFSDGGSSLSLRENSSSIYRFARGTAGWLKSPMIQIVVLEGGEAKLDLLAEPQFGSDPTEKAAINVYPMELYKPNI